MGICSSWSTPDNARHGQAYFNGAHRSRVRRARGQVVNTLRDLGVYLPLYRAAVNGEWRDARNFLQRDPEALTARITIAYETVLHIAVGTGKAIEFVENLVQQMSPENLALTDQHGETALSVAAVVGNIPAAKILINKNPDLPNISGKYGFPIHKAAQSGIRRAKGDMVNTRKDLGVYLPLYKAALRGDWRDAGNFLEQDPEALTARITIAYETALHIAVGTGENIDFVENLVQKMSPEDLTLTDQHGETALSVAAVVGNISAAMILVNKNPNLPNISGKYGFPLHKAAQFCHKNTVRYLLSVTRGDIEPNPFVGEFGGRLLIDVIAADFYDIALDLMNRYPEMATVELNGQGSALSVLARKTDVFSSSFLPKWKWRYSIWPVIYIRKKKERRTKEKQAIELVKELCKEILQLDDCKVFSMLQHALHEAAKLGVPEIIEEIVEAFPPAIWFTDDSDYNVFQLAIMYRCENVFNLIYQMTNFQILITRYIDPDENNMLHLVGRLPAFDRFAIVSSGPAFLLQREMQWFERVSNFIHPAQRVAKNKEGKTPKQVFREAHQQLMKDGAKWMKHTASSFSVFATLIATVAFAGSMHVPGGTSSTTGLPLLIHQNAFANYVTAFAISLYFSVGSIFVFLTIITSRYAEDDFLWELPARLMVGIFCLFYSITMIVMGFRYSRLLLLSPDSADKAGSITWITVFTTTMFLVVSAAWLLRIVKSINEWRMFRYIGVKGRLLH